MTKRSLFFALLLFSLAWTHSRAQGVQQVNSKSTRYQLERQVLTRWDRFEPRWYFLLFHNRYRKGPDRRNLLQLAPTLALVGQNREEAASQEQALSQVHRQELARFADRTLNKGYHLFYRRQLDRLSAALQQMNAEASGAGVPALYVQAVHAERERILADVGILLDAYLDDARKGAALREQIASLSELRSRYRALISLYQTRQQLSK